ncbi:MAG: response regulator [Planctomycetes bacterium]|nr:response regulator [Planctomycetota bacterium]
MTERRKVAGILQDLSVLYELSLSAGQSIDLDENCAAFLRTLMARKSLDFTSVWIRERFITGADSDTELIQVYANPSFRAPMLTISEDHPLVKRAEEQSLFSLAHGQPGFEELVTELGIDRGSFAVFRLGEIGILKLYSIARRDPFAPVELSKLRSVVDKFTVSLEGCLDHARVRVAELRRRELERQMLHAQKLESLGLLAGGVAHDFNNLLTAIIGSAELARLELHGHAAADLLENVITAASRAAELSAQLLAYSGGAPLMSGPVNLNEVIEEMLRLTTVSVSKLARVTSRLDPELPPVEGDVGQLRQVVMNLLTNASEALDGKAGDVVVRTGVADVSRAELGEYHLGEDRTADRYVFVDVEDTGCGMDSATQQRIFDPFFTTKFTGRGLGLAALLGIVRGHGGAIRVRSLVGNGSQVRVLLPRSMRTLPPTEPLARPSVDRTEEGVALVVDDESAVRTVLTQILRQMGFQVLSAADGRDAVRVFEEHSDEIDIVFLDLTMPELSGEEAFERMLDVDPDACVVVCSGYSEAKAHARFTERKPCAFLEKPFRIMDVTRLVSDTLARRRR